MDFFQSCFSKNDYFGLLWYYGLNNQKIKTSQLNNFDIKNLLKFVLIHEDAIEKDHWYIIFKGLCYILSLKIEFLNKNFKNLKNDLLNKNKPSLFDYEFYKLKFEEIDLSYDLNKLPIIKDVPVLTKSLKRKLFLSDKTYKNFILNDSERITFDNNSLNDDGFGGELNKECFSIQNFFDVLNLNDRKKKIKLEDESSQNSNLNFLDDDSLDFSFSNSQPSNSSIIPPSPSIFRQVDDQSKFKISNISISSRLSEENLLGIGESDTFSSKQNLSIIDQLSNKSPQDKNEEIEFVLDENLNAESQEKINNKNKSKKKLIIDNVKQLKGKFYLRNLKYHEKHSKFQLALPTITLDMIFNKPLLSNLIDNVQSHCFITEKKSIEDLENNVLKMEFSDDEFDDLQDDIDLGFILNDNDVFDNVISEKKNEEEVHSVLTSVIEQVSKQVDSMMETENNEFQRKNTDRFSNINLNFDESINIEEQDFAFEGNSISSGSNNLSYGSNTKLSILTDQSTSYVNMIKDQLKKNKKFSFFEFTISFKKKDAAKCFSDLMNLKKKRNLELIQINFFSDIMVHKI